MSDTPKERSYTYLPLKVAVETEAGSGEYEYAPRLRVREVKLACDQELSEAAIEIYTGPIFETDQHDAEDELTVADVLSGEPRDGDQGLLSPDQRVIIYRDGEEDDVERRIILSGFGEIPQYNEEGKLQGSTQGGSILIQSVLKRQAKQYQGQVYGRLVRSAESQDAWREAYAADAEAKCTAIGTQDDVVLVDRPCAFNARGEANRAPAPVTVTLDGDEHQVHVFTSDDDADAELWTWAQALRYLVYFHLLKPWDDDAATVLIDETNLWDQTADYIADGLAERPASPVEETEDYSGDPYEEESSILKWCLLGLPNDAVLEGNTILDALACVCHATDTHFRVRTTGDEEPWEELLFWATGAGPRKTVSKDWTADDMGTLTAGEILEKLNVDQFNLTADYSDVLTGVIGLGDLRRYEITAELVPGWKPNDDWDDVADEDEAIEAAEAHLNSSDPDSDDWFSKYHTVGAQFASYADVGRRWVLNETGRYTAADYARDAGAFGASAYAPWEPSDCDITDSYVKEDGTLGTQAVEAGDWARYPRPFLPCFSAVQKRSIGVIVEASFDAGSTWQRVECKVLNVEAGIYLEQDDLAQGLVSIRDPDLHWAKACIRGDARIRVTGVIEGDQRVSSQVAADAYKVPIAHQATRQFDWSERIKCNRRDGGNSQFGAGGAKPAPDSTPEARDDLLLLVQRTHEILELLTARQTPASFSIPWLELAGYEVGDCIEEFAGQGLTLEGSASARARRPPDVVAIRYATGRTQLVLADPQMVDIGGSAWVD